MSLRPFWQYYGGKWRSVPRYPRPLHHTIIEPFAGAAGYATRYHKRRIILVEKYPRIARLWRYLIRVSASEIMSLPVDIDTVEDLKACEEARDLVGFWMNTGASRPCKTLSKWGRQRAINDPNNTIFWGEKARARIAHQVDQIRHWTVIEGDSTTSPDIKASWFIDPPYQDKGCHYVCGSSGIDFEALGQWCKSRQGQVIVCEGPGAQWLPFKALFDLSTARSKQGQAIKRTEMIWTSGCLNQGDLFL